MKIKFLGAAGNVTGSRFLVEYDSTRILVDCGLFQERDYLERNWVGFPVEPASIDAIILTHAHLDHSGFIPRLVNSGFSGKIYCTEATAEITHIALVDAAHIFEEDAAFKKKRHEKEGRRGPHPEIPLYTREDAEKSMALFYPIAYGKPIEVTRGLKATFHDAGHILGSSMVTIDTKDFRVLFSGDVGRWGKPILRDPTVFDQADYLVIESTYGDRIHDDGTQVSILLADIINRTRKAGGNIVIPSFSIERTQEVIYYINQLVLQEAIPPLPVFLDSPMADRVNRVFHKFTDLYDDDMKELIRTGRSPFQLKTLHVTRTVEESKSINYIRGTAIIIAGSGMCVGGRVKHHLVNNIERKECSIVFVGYQAKGTLGREIVDGLKSVRIFGKKRNVRARIFQLHGFSGHADRNELVRWVSSFKSPPRGVFIVHGEHYQAEGFRRLLMERMGWSAIPPSLGDVVELR
ncbi:MAG: MBL fold metallo-hydrolase RNA specificity domain-containing protein [bacterium]